MLEFLFRLIGRLPLAWLHALGTMLGRMVYAVSPSYAKRVHENIRLSGVCAATDSDRLVRRVVAETGKAVTELAALWFAPANKVQGWMHCDNWAVAEVAGARGKGIIFLTPHLGGFEICAHTIAQRLPMTVMYRPPKMRWLEPLMLAGRGRFGANVVPADLKGVRAFFRALKNGQAVGLLPDQTPGVGEGAWADFFGRPAYTMTLVQRLSAATGAALVMVHARRMASGAGFSIQFEEIPAVDFSERKLNSAVEAVVRRCPEQYLWGYNRYKTPEGALPPPAKERIS